MDVQSYMSTDLVTIQPSTKIIEALDLMKEHKIHRLPVVQGETIVGLITEGIIERNTPSSMTSLDMHEVNYLLNKTTVSDIMEKRVVTINKEALLEEAAVTMRENGISVLPVVEPGNRLIGIITEKDIFSAFIDVLGYYTPGVRVVVNIHEDKKGVLEDLTDIFSMRTSTSNRLRHTAKWAMSKSSSSWKAKISTASAPDSKNTATKSDPSSTNPKEHRM